MLWTLVGLASAGVLFAISAVRYVRVRLHWREYVPDVPLFFRFKAVGGPAFGLSLLPQDALAVNRLLEALDGLEPGGGGGVKAPP